MVTRQWNRNDKARLDGEPVTVLEVDGLFANVRYQDGQIGRRVMLSGLTALPGSPYLDAPPRKAPPPDRPAGRPRVNPAPPRLADMVIHADPFDSSVEVVTEAPAEVVVVEEEVPAEVMVGEPVIVEAVDPIPTHICEVCEPPRPFASRQGLGTHRRRIHEGGPQPKAENSLAYWKGKYEGMAEALKLLGAVIKGS